MKYNKLNEEPISGDWPKMSRYFRYNFDDDANE